MGRLLSVALAWVGPVYLLVAVGRSLWVGHCGSAAVGCCETVAVGRSLWIVVGRSLCESVSVGRSGTVAVGCCVSQSLWVGRCRSL